MCTPVSSDPLSCTLFTFRGIVVAIDLVGAGIPLALSVVFIAFLIFRGRGHLDLHRIAVFALLAVTLGAAAAVEYILWYRAYGVQAVNTQLLLDTVLIPVGVAEFLLLDRTRWPRLSLLQTYVVGTVGTSLSDLIRAFSGTLSVSPQIMGAARLTDAVFLDGLLLMLGYLVGGILYLSVLRLTRGRRPPEKGANS